MRIGLTLAKLKNFPENGCDPTGYQTEHEENIVDIAILY